MSPVYIIPNLLAREKNAWFLKKTEKSIFSTQFDYFGAFEAIFTNFFNNKQFNKFGIFSKMPLF